MCKVEEMNRRGRGKIGRTGEVNMDQESHVLNREKCNVRVVNNACLGLVPFFARTATIIALPV